MRWHRREGCYSSPEAKRAQRAYRRDNKARIRESQKRYAKANQVQLNAAARGRYAADPGKFRARNRAWARVNPEKVLAYSKAYGKRVRRQTPPWADMDAITTLYLNCPPGFQVDHIVPLKAVDEDGLRVASGLHISANLQYLPALENVQKKNRLLYSRSAS
jgi:hypothetical protein